MKSQTEVENTKLRKENTDLKARVDIIETAAEVAKQYRRRKCTRYQRTRRMVARAMDLDLVIEEIDRSRRIGKKKTT